MKINLPDLFNYYRSSLELENILSIKIMLAKIKEVQQVNLIADIKAGFNNSCKNGNELFKFKPSDPFDKYILVELLDDDEDYNKCFEELKFLEKTLNYSKNNKLTPNQSSKLEKDQHFVYPDTTLYQYNICFNVISLISSKNELVPLFILTFKSTNIDGELINSDILFEQIKKCMGRDYDHDIDRISLLNPTLFINPYVIEEYQCAELDFEFTNFNEVTEKIARYIKNNELLSENIISHKSGTYLCAVSPKMSAGLVLIYNQVLKSGANKLLNKYFSVHKNKKSNIQTDSIDEEDVLTTSEVINAYSKHTGAFDSNYPLAETQRVALSCFLNEKNSVLPVNGAPGTGKTSLLRCIFGQYIVDSAIESYKQYIDKKLVTFRTPIVCSSTNNQALSNISEGVESGFADQIAKNPDNLLYKRWIKSPDSLSDKKASENSSKDLDKSSSIDLSKQLFVPSIKKFSKDRLELNKSDLMSIVNNIKDQAASYLEYFNEYKPNYLDKNSSIYEQLNACAKYFNQRIEDNNQIIKKAIVTNADFLALAEFEKYILDKYSKNKYSLLKIKQSLSTISNDMSSWYENIEKLGKAELELTTIRNDINSNLHYANKLFKQISDIYANNYNMDQMISTTRDLLNDTPENTSIYADSLKQIYQTQLHHELNIINTEHSNKIAYYKSSSSILQKILHLLKKGKLYRKILVLNIELDEKIKLTKQTTLTKAEKEALSATKKTLDSSLDKIMEIKDSYDLKLEEEKCQIDTINSIKKRSLDLVVLELSDIKSLLKFNTTLNAFDEITNTQLKLDTKERTENFYYALHLIEALFFIKYQESSKIICPNCKKDSLYKPQGKDLYRCGHCNACHSRKKSSGLSDLEVEKILKHDGCVINDKYYQVTCKKEDGNIWINIGPSNQFKTDIDFNTLLPIFPMINLTCNSFGSIVAYDKNKIPQDLFDFVLVDEAGTILPSKMIILYCAKRCMLFGDAKQLKPIFNYSSKLELNLITLYINDHESRKITNEYFSCATDSQEIGIANNAILVGNNCCQIILPYNKSKLEGDLWLKEHFRCKNPIIAIANELTYENEIIPRAGDDGHLFFIESSGTKTSDHINITESEMIAEYIINERDKLCSLLNAPNLSDKDYYNSIGIITPFRNQEQQIIKSLKANKIFPSPTVGTVHKFQGSERKIIIFSTVYDKGTPEKLFFNREDTSMINVAVTRAKNIFICFGNSELLTKSSYKPSSLDNSERQKKSELYSGVMVKHIKDHESRSYIQ